VWFDSCRDLAFRFLYAVSHDRAWLKGVSTELVPIEEEPPVFAYTYPLLDLFWTMLEIFAFIVYLWVIIAIFTDIFRSHDLGGGAKMLWVLFVFIVPVIGLLAYLLIRGGSMHERAAKQAEQQQEKFNAYVRDAAGASQTDQLSKLADLKERGAITDAEFETQKAKVLAQ
jgi:ABC-type multidrug transport system fused ATPase/permease subunit